MSPGVGSLVAKWIAGRALKYKQGCPVVFEQIFFLLQVFGNGKIVGDWRKYF